MSTINKLICRLLPDFITEPIIVYRQHLAVKRTHDALRKVSKDVRPELMQNLRVLPNRFAMLNMMPKDAVVAEVGVAEGSFSKAILQLCRPKRLHLVDMWTPESNNINYNEQAFAKVKNSFSVEIQAGQIQLHQGVSWDVLKTFPDDYFDWVYIDASHTYESVRQDLLAAHKKIKAPGYITGHDYTQWGDALARWGVVEAVNEFCNEHNFEMVFITHEKNGHISYAIRRAV